MSKKIEITINIHTGGTITPDDRTKLTLRQLRSILPSTEGVDAPPAAWFREHAEHIFCVIRDKDAVLTVYTNGFYTYGKPDYPCVMRVDGFKAIRYDRSKQFTDTADIPEEEYLDEPFVGTLMYRGDFQWEANAEKREVARRELLIDGDEKQWSGLHEFAEPGFLAELEEMEREAERNAKLYEAMEHLTQRQKQIVLLRFYKNMTQKDISDLLGVRQQSVLDVLNAALIKLRRELGDR